MDEMVEQQKIRKNKYLAGNAQGLTLQEKQDFVNAHTLSSGE